MKRGIVWSLLFGVFGIGGVLSANAATFNSSNFSINGNIGDSAAGAQTSTNYKLTSAAGESIAGDSASTSYRLAQGYIPQLGITDNAIQVNVQPNGLIGYWPLENSAGGATAFDESANTNNGTYSTGSGTTTGKVGQAWNDSNGTQYVNIPNSASQTVGNKMTISAWVNNSGSSGQPAILSKWQYNPNAGSWALQAAPSPANLRMFVRASGSDDGQNYVDSTNAGMAFNTWYFVTMVYDGTLANSDRVKLYVNGNQVATTTAGTIPTSITSSTHDIRIGDFPGLNRYWSGGIDEVKLFSRALTQSEITAEYQATNAGIPAGVSLGAVTPGISQTAAFDSIVQSSAGNYTLSANQNNNLTNGGNTISGVSGSIASPVAWNEGVTKGLGFTLYSTNATAIPGSWASGNAYAALPATSTSFYTRSGASGSSKDVVNMRLRLDTQTSQVAGSYTSQMTITGTMVP